jgi:hypothetical protein
LKYHRKFPVSAVVGAAISVATGYSVQDLSAAMSAARSAVVVREADDPAYGDGYRAGYAGGLDWGRSHCGSVEETDPAWDKSGPYWDSYKQGYLAGFPEGLSLGQAGHYGA